MNTSASFLTADLSNRIRFWSNDTGGDEIDGTVSLFAAECKFAKCQHKCLIFTSRAINFELGMQMKTSKMTAAPITRMENNTRRFR